MGFPFTLKGFPHKFGILYFSAVIFLLQILFKHTVIIHIYDTIHVYGYYSSSSRNTTRE